MIAPAGRRLALQAIGQAATWVSLHSADPADGGPYEVTGRRPATWVQMPAGELVLERPVTFDVPGSTVVGWFGLWTERSGGWLLATGQLDGPETFGQPGGYELVEATVDLT